MEERLQDSARSEQIKREFAHLYEQGLHLQQVHEAVMALNTAIASLPEYDAQAMPEEPFPLSSLASFVAQPLVDLIRQMLDSSRVILLAVGSTGRLSYVAGSGFTAEQEQVFRSSNELVTSMFFDEQALARLSVQQEVFLTSEDLRHRTRFASEFGFENLLVLPLFLEKQFAGILTIFKAGSSGGYTSEETEFAKILVLEIELLVECLSIMRERIESATGARVQQEVGHLSNSFLTLASHELKTPLTGIIGNLQLAQQRLARLKRQIREQAEEVNKSIERIETPLASAIESAHLQQDVIHEMIDTLSMQTRPLDIQMKEENLLTLLQAMLTRMQRSAPLRTIALTIPQTIQAVLVRVDGQQIIQVLTNYLINVLSHSPIELPVTVQLVVADTVALILVKDGGLGLVPEEQKFLWQRFSQGKSHAIQHEVDVNLGTGFYLCKMLIEQYHGHVGVQSNPEEGTTFWLTLPIEAILEK
ncbi:hypothetical protein KSF_035970 [Reticulibacter mediterranei]|uniref:histidine kinase n=1 Tax=Reticulibacter mediterranei TaxID=2778369 RepID=A0A8J3MZW2_9CHLR|nr:HAMP domain-containing sensor histidine kinase [Reticulibacter mediterranei]GHO93549.1 hypothetical protein KSF_035970 [Reticulibacter mediterranei]